MKRIKQLIIGLIIAAVAVYFTLRNVSIKDVAASFATIHYIYLLPAAGITIAGFVIRAYRWRLLLTQVKDVKTTDLLPPLMIGYMGNFLPARAGELIRAYLLGKQQGITFTGAFATIVVERIFDTIMILGLFAWMLMASPQIFNNGGQWAGMPLSKLAYNFGILAIAAVMALLALVYLLLFHKARITSLIQWMIKPLPGKLHDHVEHTVEKFSEGLSIVRDFDALLKIFFCSVLTWLFIALSYYPLYFAYGLEDKSAASLAVLIIMICIFIAVFPTPGFVGSFQAGVLIALHEIMREAEVAAVSFGMVAWALNMGIVAIMGTYYILRGNMSFHQLTEVEEKP